MLTEYMDIHFREKITGLATYISERVALSYCAIAILGSVLYLLAGRLLHLILGYAVEKKPASLDLNDIAGHPPHLQDGLMDSGPPSPNLTVENYSWIVHAQRCMLSLMPPLENDSDTSSSSSSSESSTMTVHRSPSPPPKIEGDLFQPLQLDGTDDVPGHSVDCGVCQESFTAAASIINVPDCDHPFCYDCLRTHTVTKIQENQFPILCPTCSSNTTNSNPSKINQMLVDDLGVTQANFDRFVELEMLEFAIPLNCPKCKNAMFVDRKEYADLKLLKCPLPTCGHRWCRDCAKTVDDSVLRHRCKDKQLKRVMKRKGWRYCPGCLSPIERSEGCNHMTCKAPGCHVHFCYQCGDNIIDTTHGGDVGMAVTDHMGSCRMAKSRMRRMMQCVIQ